MQTITFYSYKGGVGRTLALANVAADFCLLGENVFLIDFDLEAPGLDSFGFLSGPVPKSKEMLHDVAGHNVPGLTDLILEYMNTPDKGVPDLAKFVIKSQQMHRLSHKYGKKLSEKHSDRGREYEEGKPGDMFFLPAGSGAAFDKIDWQKLYSELDGFLFFEALKAEIANKYAPEWLFVDSRTGRAEIAGICTRQLADINVLVFFPNAQNINGLNEIREKLADNTSREASGKDPVEFVYVASRVPVGRDKEGIIKAQLDNFADFFRIDKNEIIQLPHNDSLGLLLPKKESHIIYDKESEEDLLSRELFAVSMPDSPLAENYCKLSSELLLQNQNSLSGAKLYFHYWNRWSCVIDPEQHRRNKNFREHTPRNRWFYYDKGWKGGESVNEVLMRAETAALNHASDYILNWQLGHFYLEGSQILKQKNIEADEIKKMKAQCIFHYMLSLLLQKTGIYVYRYETETVIESFSNHILQSFRDKAEITFPECLAIKGLAQTAYKDHYEEIMTSLDGKLPKNWVEIIVNSLDTVIRYADDSIGMGYCGNLMYFDNEYGSVDAEPVSKMIDMMTCYSFSNNVTKVAEFWSKIANTLGKKPNVLIYYKNDPQWPPDASAVDLDHKELAKYNRETAKAIKEVVKTIKERVDELLGFDQVSDEVKEQLKVISADLTALEKKRGNQENPQSSAR